MSHNTLSLDSSRPRLIKARSSFGKARKKQRLLEREQRVPRNACCLTACWVPA